MRGGTASVEFSTGHTVDTKGTSPLEKILGRTGCECVGACPALPATEMSICPVICLLAFSSSHIKGAVYKKVKEMSEFMVALSLCVLVKFVQNSHSL